MTAVAIAVFGEFAELRYYSQSECERLHVATEPDYFQAGIRVRQPTLNRTGKLGTSEGWLILPDRVCERIEHRQAHDWSKELRPRLVTGLSGPPPVAELRLGRRTALTLALLFPPPQKN